MIEALLVIVYFGILVFSSYYFNVNNLTVRYFVDALHTRVIYGKRAEQMENKLNHNFFISLLMLLLFIESRKWY